MQRNTYSLHTVFVLINYLSAAHNSHIMLMLVGISHQKRNAPNGTKTNKCVNDSADHTCLTAANPSNDIELENTDWTPVYTADNEKYQRNFVKHKKLPFKSWFVCNSIFDRIIKNYTFFWYVKKVIFSPTLCTLPIFILILKLHKKFSRSIVKVFAQLFFKKLACLGGAQWDFKGNALNDIILLKNSAVRNFYKPYCTIWHIKERFAYL